MRSVIVTALCFLFLTSPTALAADAEQVRKQLRQTFPGQTFQDVKPSPVGGFYEVTIGDQIVYTDGRHLFQGDLYELQTLNNLTKLSLLDSVSDDEAVVFAPAGKTQRTITVFTDSTCGYCRKLHQEIDTLTTAGIKVRYLLYPRAGLGSPAAKTLEGVWCADNQQQALTAAKAGKQIPEKRCDNPIEENISLAHRFGLRGTPLIITDAGVVIPGYKPSDELIQMLNEQP